MLAGNGSSAAFAQRLEFSLEMRLIEQMRAGDPVVQRNASFGEAGDRLETLRAPKAPSDQIPVPKAVIGCFERERVSEPVVAAVLLLLGHCGSIPGKQSRRRTPVCGCYRPGGRPPTEERTADGSRDSRFGGIEQGKPIRRPKHRRATAAAASCRSCRWPRSWRRGLRRRLRPEAERGTDCR